jgi:hypothetical protein
MRVTYRWRPGPNLTPAEAMETEITVTCRSIFVRDGVLTMVGGHGDDAVEHGIPVDRLAEYRIFRSAPNPEVPEPGSPAAERLSPFGAVREALHQWVDDTRANHAAWDHRDEEPGRGCYQILHVNDVAGIIDHAQKTYADRTA